MIVKEGFKKQVIDFLNSNDLSIPFWVGITGSWRVTNDEIESDVRDCIKTILENGGGIVTGGALNVDYFATDEVLKFDPSGKAIKVFIPATIDIYAQHYRNRANEGVITNEQAEKLIIQLSKLSELGSLIGNTSNRVVDKDTYYDRNTKVVEESDLVVAFHVNNSGGVQDTINKAEKLGKPVLRFEYVI